MFNGAKYFLTYLISHSKFYKFISDSFQKKEKVIVFVFVMIFSYSSNNFLNNVIKNPLKITNSVINIAIADNLWDYFSRFNVNN